MKALVTGAAGFLGTELVSRLMDTGHRQVRCLIRPGHDDAALRALAAPYADATLEIVRGNMTSRADVERALDGVDVVFHLAAAMKGSAADMFLNTVVGSKRLLDAMANHPDTKVILVSSLGVYGVAALPPGARLDENSPLEPHPETRDPYSYSKWRQERLFAEYHERTGLRLVTLRPGVIYGRGGAPMSSRVGVNVFGVYLSLGGHNALPLSHVKNCADALIVAATVDRAEGNVYNVCDDRLPTCAQFLRQYRRRVRPLRVLPVPYPAMQALSWAVKRYHEKSGGQLPAVFTPYRTASLWKGTRFTNERLKALGWTPRISTADGMRDAFEYWHDVEAAARRESGR